ncbi:MAG TPA: ATP-binding protein [Dongiaceae bacterium]|nr:ATP-binding protein [Dongiaceae bacterium]
MGGAFPFRRIHLVLLLGLLAGCGLLTASIRAEEVSGVKTLSIAALEEYLTSLKARKLSFRLEGQVRAVVPEAGLLALQDASGTELLELPLTGVNVSVGDWIAIEANPCLVAQTRFGARVEDVPVVNNDGSHSDTEKTGTITLEAGMNPIRLEWFNGPSEFSLSLACEGPGISLQPVPAARLWHAVAGMESPQSGLDYQAYEGTGWQSLPDFCWLNSVAAGRATNFNLACRTRDENCALVFTGLLQVDQPGAYTFHLKSDDGSRLYIGRSGVTCQLLTAPGGPLPAPESFQQALADRGSSHWVQMEGEVTFVSQDQRRLNLGMVVGGNQVPVTVIEGKGQFSTNWLHSWIQLQGVCEFSRNPEDRRLVGVFVPGLQLVRVQKPEENLRDAAVTLVTAAEVRRLKPVEAGRQIPARIRGVVIYASAVAVVLQDSSGGVFISYRNGHWPEQPETGELWEMEGATDPGDFSPVVVASRVRFLGYAPLPEPIQPTRDQLMNGNMDAEYGELHGVVTAVSTNEITVLTPDGTVSVLGASDRPLPALPRSVPDGAALVGSVVRIRGCFATSVDLQTRQVAPGKIYIYPAQLEVEDAMPADPFLLPTRTPANLMWFDARASALQRTKLAGQVVYALPGECFVLADRAGFRVLTRNAVPEVGDLIEAVGFPKLAGPSPVLQEAQIRITGHAPLPAPVVVPPDKLLDRDLDANRVQITALLVIDTVHQGERVLEVQSGPQHFMARVANIPSGSPLPVGSRLKLTGIYASAAGDREHVGLNFAPFELLLNRTADIVVLERPSWWTIQRVVMMLVVLSGALSIMFIWVALLRRQVEQRTAQLKREIEQRQLVEQHHAIEMERTRVARDLHDELGAGLTEVGLLGSLASTPAVAPEAKGRYLEQLTQMARSLVTSLDEIVWAVNPHYDSLPSLVSYFSLHAESFLNLAGITCRLQVAENIPACPLDSKRRHEIFRAFKEALNNVVRHARATEVQIGFAVVAEQLVLSVIDNGCGFEFVPGLPGKDGLSSLDQRMQQLGGICEISSQPGQGTKVELRLPLNGIEHGKSRDR